MRTYVRVRVRNASDCEASAAMSKFTSNSTATKFIPDEPDPVDPIYRAALMDHILMKVCVDVCEFCKRCLFCASIKFPAYQHTQDFTKPATYSCILPALQYITSPAPLGVLRNTM